jgi:hypothetical protein
MGPRESDTSSIVTIQNNFSVVKVIPKVELNKACRKLNVGLEGVGGSIPFQLTEADQALFSELNLKILTSKSYYDLMTDYPYTLFDAKGNTLASGGAELDTQVSVAPLVFLPTGTLHLSISGSFAMRAPDKWMIEIEESRTLQNPVTLATLTRVVLNQGQTTDVPVNTKPIAKPLVEGFKNCPEMTLSTPEGELIQSIPLWRE